VTVAPDYASPLLGWRAWLVLRRAEGVRLASVAHPTLWEPHRELKGECLAPRRLPLPRRWRRHGHDAPDATCSCGIYAGSGPDVAGPYVFRPLVARRHLVVRVIGLVSLWGRVVACERGWRAECAYPSRIFVPVPATDSKAWRRVDELAFALAEYGVPVDVVPHRGEQDLVYSLA
jgi:hypothetical protein